MEGSCRLQHSKDQDRLDYRFLNIGKRCTRLQHLYDASKEETVTSLYSAALFIPFLVTVATDRIDRTTDRGDRTGNRRDRTDDRTGRTGDRA